MSEKEKKPKICLFKPYPKNKKKCHEKNQNLLTTISISFLKSWMQEKQGY